MVGSLIRVGEGRLSADDLAMRSRAREPPPLRPPWAPACGLYLAAVSYPNRLWRLGRRTTSEGRLS